MKKFRPFLLLFILLAVTHCAKKVNTDISETKSISEDPDTTYNHNRQISNNHKRIVDIPPYEYMHVF